MATIHDGKQIEPNIEGISKSQLEEILGLHGKLILDGVDKKIGEMPKQTVIYGNGSVEDSKEEMSEESLKSIAKEMVKKQKVDSNFSSLGKQEEIKVDNKKMKNTLDLLNNL